MKQFDLAVRRSFFKLFGQAPTPIISVPRYTMCEQETVGNIRVDK